jgi:hypothetical protein
MDILNMRDHTFVEFPIILVSAKNSPDNIKFSKRIKYLSYNYLVLQIFGDTSKINLSLMIKDYSWRQLNMCFKYCWIIKVYN